MIIPVLHRILVKQDKLEEKDELYKNARKAGIEIPDLNEHSREQAAIDTGTVVAIGETAFRDFNASNVVAIGDSIVFAKHAGKKIQDPYTEEWFVALNDEDVIAKFKEPKNG